MDSEDTKMHNIDETLTGELDIRKAFRTVWLVKVPAFMFDVWKNSASNSTLGTVTVSEFANGDAQTSLIASTLDPSIPKEYDLSPPAKVPVGSAPQVGQTFILSEEGEGESTKLAIEGSVNSQHKFDMKPKYSKEYKSVLRNRLRQSENKTRQTVTIDTNEIVTTPSHAILKLSPYARKPIDNANKRERKDRTTMLQEIFKIFEKQAHYQTKELEVLTQQPNIYLKTILEEVCIFNKRGPNKGKWELKPLFKNKNLEQQQIQAAKEQYHHNLKTQNEWLGIQNKQ